MQHNVPQQGAERRYLRNALMHRRQRRAKARENEEEAGGGHLPRATITFQRAVNRSTEVGRTSVSERRGASAYWKPEQ